MIGDVKLLMSQTRYVATAMISARNTIVPPRRIAVNEMSLPSGNSFEMAD